MKTGDQEPGRQILPQHAAHSMAKFCATRIRVSGLASRSRQVLTRDGHAHVLVPRRPARDDYACLLDPPPARIGQFLPARS